MKRKLYVLFNQFLWGGNADKSKLDMVNWEKVAALVVEGGAQCYGFGGYEFCASRQMDLQIHQ